MRNSYSKLHSKLPDSTWIVLGDLTIDIGKIKSLVTVAVDLSKLEERKDYTLFVKDLHIVGIHPTIKSNGIFVCEAFREDLQRLEGSVDAFIIDGGSDLQRGAKLLNEAIERTISVSSSNESTPALISSKALDELKPIASQEKESEIFEKIIELETLPKKKPLFLYDLSHKLSLVLEKELTADPNWEEYTKNLINSRRLMAQTEFAAIMPPKLRSKARFMNAALYIDWPERILNIKKAGNLDEIPSDRYEKYFGWLSTYWPWLDKWIPKVKAIEMIKDVIRTHGLSEDVHTYLKDTFSVMPLENEILNFTNTALDSVYEEVKKLDVDQTLPVFTEAIESTFGAHKNHIGRSGQGICSNVITIATLVGPLQTVDEIHKGMEEVPVRDMNSWVKKKIGETVGSLRRKFLKNKSESTSSDAKTIKGTKFDNFSPLAATG